MEDGVSIIDKLFGCNCVGVNKLFDVEDGVSIIDKLFGCNCVGIENDVELFDNDSFKEELLDMTVVTELVSVNCGCNGVFRCLNEWGFC